MATTTITESGNYGFSAGAADSYIIKDGVTGVNITDNNADQAVQDNTTSNDLFVVENLTNTTVVINDYATVSGVDKNTNDDLLYIKNAGDGVKVAYFNIYTKAEAVNHQGGVDVAFVSTSANATGSVTAKNHLTINASGNYDEGAGYIDNVLAGEQKVNFNYNNLISKVRTLISKANTALGTSYTSSDDLKGTAYEAEMMALYNGTDENKSYPTYTIGDLSVNSTTGPLLTWLYPVDELEFTQVAGTNEVCITHGNVTQRLSYEEATFSYYAIDQGTYEYKKIDDTMIASATNRAVYELAADATEHATIAGADFGGVWFRGVTDWKNITYRRDDDNLIMTTNDDRQVTVNDFFSETNKVVARFLENGSAAGGVLNDNANVEMFVNLSQFDGTYQATEYREVFEGSGVVSGLNALSDKVKLTYADVQLSRTFDGDNNGALTLTDGTNTITVNDYFGESYVARLIYDSSDPVGAGKSILSKPLDVTLADTENEYTTHEKFQETIHGKGIIAADSIGVAGTNKDRIVLDGDATFTRENNGDLHVKYGESDDITVTDFDFGGATKNINVNGTLTDANTVINVTLTDDFEYTPSAYADAISGVGSVAAADLATTGNDKLAIAGDVTYERTNGGDLHVKGTGSDITVTDFDFAEGTTNIKVNDGDTQNMVIDVELTGSDYISAAGYAERITTIGDSSIQFYPEGQYTGQDTLVFDTENITYRRSGDDLVITHSPDEVTEISTTVLGYYKSDNMAEEGQFARAQVSAGEINTTLGDLNVSYIENVSNITGTDNEEAIELVTTTGVIPQNASGDFPNYDEETGKYTSNVLGNREVKIDAYAAGMGGDDLIEGTDGNDWINGGDGGDTIYGGTKGKDMLAGGDGENLIFAGDFSGATPAPNTDGVEIYGGKDKDIIYAGGNNETENYIWAHGGNDVINLYGGKNTIMLVEDGADATAGNDTIYGATSLDTLKFVSRDGDGEVIKGFAVSDLTFAKSGDDLTITTPDASVTTIADFFKGQNVDTIVTKDGEKSIKDDAVFDVVLDSEHPTFDKATSGYAGYRVNVIANDSAVEKYTIEGLSATDNVTTGSETYEYTKYDGQSNRLFVNNVELVNYESDVKIDGEAIDYANSTVNYIMSNQYSQYNPYNHGFGAALISGKGQINSFAFGEHDKLVLDVTSVDEDDNPLYSFTYDDSKQNEQDALVITDGTNRFQVDGPSVIFDNFIPPVKDLNLADVELDVVNVYNSFDATTFPGGFGSVNVSAYDSSVDVTLTGATGDDTLRGASGNDTITGGKGHDELYGKGGNDTFVFNAEDGKDLIMDAKEGDIIKFGNKTFSELGFIKNDDDLEIAYGINDTVVVYDFFKGQNVDTILTNDEIGTHSIKDEAVFNIDLDKIEGHVFDKSAAGYTGYKVNVTGTGSVANIETGDKLNSAISNVSRSGNDLVLDTITVKGYYKTNNMADAGQCPGVIVGNTTLGDITVTRINNVSDIIGSDSNGEIIHLVKTENIIPQRADNEFPNYDSGAGTYISNVGHGKIKIDAYAAGMGGADVIYGTEGNDWINGGDGNDLIVGGASGKDMLAGGDGQNEIYAGTFVNKEFKPNEDGVEIYGGKGLDMIYAGGKDTTENYIWAHGGDDKIYLNGGKNTIMLVEDGADAKAGNDTIFGATSSDTLKFVSRDGDGEVIKGFAVSELSFAKSGDGDLIITTSDNSTVTIKDYFETAEADRVKTFMTTDGTLTLEWKHSNVENADYMYNVTSNTEKNLVTGIRNWVDGYTTEVVSVTGVSAGDMLAGSIKDDTITAGDGGAELYGDEGNDTLIGGAGADYIRGKEGNDTLTGKGGADVFAIDSGNDVITDATSADVIKFVDNYRNDFTGITFAKGEGEKATSLMVSFGENSSVEIKNYFNVDGTVAENHVNKFAIVTEQAGTKEYTLGWHDGAMYNEIRNTDDKIITAVSGIQNWIDGQSKDASGKTITGGDKYDMLAGTQNADTITAGANGAEIYGDGGADTITATKSFIVGGSGTDTINVSGGNNTIMFLNTPSLNPTENDSYATGTDTVNGATSGDVLKFAYTDKSVGYSVEDLSFAKDGDNLVITAKKDATHENTVNLTNFFKSTDNVDTLWTTDGEKSIKDDAIINVEITQAGEYSASDYKEAYTIASGIAGNVIIHNLDGQKDSIKLNGVDFDDITFFHRDGRLDMAYGSTLVLLAGYDSAANKLSSITTSDGTYGFAVGNDATEFTFSTESTGNNIIIGALDGDKLNFTNIDKSKVAYARNAYGDLVITTDKEGFAVTLKGFFSADVHKYAHLDTIKFNGSGDVSILNNAEINVNADSYFLGYNVVNDTATAEVGGYNEIIDVTSGNLSTINIDDAVLNAISSGDITKTHDDAGYHYTLALGKDKELASIIVGQLGDDTIYDSEGNDYLAGADGVDTIISTKGEDALIGGEGADYLYAKDNTSDVEIYGGAGDDVINSGSGKDFIWGGAGKDEIHLNGGNNRIILSDADFGSDTIYGATANDTLEFVLRKGGEVVQGHNFDELTFVRNNADLEIFVGNNSKATISGFFTAESKVDTILTKDGEKSIKNNAVFSVVLDSEHPTFDKATSGYGDYKVTVSGTGSVSNLGANDRLVFESETTYSLDKSTGLKVSDATNSITVMYDTEIVLPNVYIGDTKDVIANKKLTVTGFSNFDASEVGFGSYDITGTNGNDTLTGGDGKDFIKGGEGNDTLNGGAGDDTINSNFGNDVLNGGEGNDYLNAAINDDNVEIYGGAGKDHIFAGLGDDFIQGGAGDDEIDLTKGGKNRIILSDADFGSDEIIKADADDTLEFVLKDGETVQGYNFSELSFAKKGNDLEISAGSSKATISGFFTAESKVDKILALNEAGNEIQEYSIKDNVVIHIHLEGETFNKSESGLPLGYKVAVDGYGTVIGLESGDTVAVADDATFSRVYEGTDLVINNGEHSWTVKGYFAKDEHEVAIGNQMSFVDSNGVVDLDSKTLDVNAAPQGTEGVTYIAENERFGFGVIDFTGTDNADTYTGDDEDSIIIGGKGNDTLVGNTGKNTFVFSQEDGIDEITNAKSGDIIKMTDVNFDDLTFSRSVDEEQNPGDDLLISYGNGDKIIVDNYFNTPVGARISTFLTADSIDPHEYVYGEKPIPEEEIQKNNGKIVIPNDPTTYSGDFKVDATEYESVSTKGINVSNTKNKTVSLDVKGSIYNDTVNAKYGNNTVVEELGTNKITTGAGADVVKAENYSSNTINVGDGNNIVYLNSVGTNKVTAGKNNNAIAATAGSNNIKLGNGANQVALTGGVNTLSTGKGDNAVILDGGVNKVTTGAGMDEYIISGGNNNVKSGNGIDKFEISDGYNTINTGNGGKLVVGADTITTGDKIEITGGTNVITSGKHDDTYVISGGNNNITSGSGADQFWIGYESIADADDDDGVKSVTGGVNAINAGSGVDTFHINSGASVLNGAAGNDVYKVDMTEFDFTNPDNSILITDTKGKNVLDLTVDGSTGPEGTGDRDSVYLYFDVDLKKKKNGDIATTKKGNSYTYSTMTFTTEAIDGNVNGIDVANNKSISKVVINKTEYDISTTQAKTDLAALAQDVANWLTSDGRSYDSTAEAFKANDAKLGELIGKYVYFSDKYFGNPGEHV